MEQKIIYFQKDIVDILQKILEDNGLKETIDDYFAKKNNGGKPYLAVFNRLTYSFSCKKIDEISFILNVQKELITSEQIAKNILKGVKEKILPLVKVITTTETEPQEEKPITALPVNLIDETKTASPKQPITEKVITPPAEKIVVPTRRKVKPAAKPVEVVKPVIQQHQGPDNYREPIE